VKQTIGFIGLGRMGLPIATSLLDAGHTLRVHNRSPEKAASLRARGVDVAPSPALTVARDSLVFSMVPDDDALAEISLGSEGLLSRLGAGGTHVSLSTVSPETSRQLAMRHAEVGATYVAAPVLGRPAAAAARKLWVVASGHATGRASAAPFLEQIGQGVFDLGDDPGAASVAKLANNFMIAAALEALGEALAFGEKQGLARSALADLFASTLFASPLYATYGKVIAEHAYEPAGFTSSLGRKDLALVLEAAAGAAVPMPTAHLLYDRLTRAVATGGGERDWASVAALASADAGLGTVNE
jgi:3-hydroxyisobutyrate dehydrogenase-like beta-hydroxyacid dehydrogenase